MKLRENKTIFLPPDITNRRARGLFRGPPFPFPRYLLGWSPNRLPDTAADAGCWLNMAADRYVLN